MTLAKTINANLFDKAAFFCAISFMFFIPISTALMNIFIFFTLIFSILSGNLRNKLRLIWNNPISRSGLLLFIFLALSLTWSITDLKEGLDYLKKYNELWYIALLLPLFNSNFRRNIGINAFLLSMSIILIGVYLIFFEIILPIEFSIKGIKQSFTINGGFASHVITNILMAFAMFVAAHKSVFSKGIYKVVYFIFFIFSLYYVLMISTGTSGQILGISLLTLFIVQHAKFRSILIVPIILIAIIVYGYLTGNHSLKFAYNKLQDQYHYVAHTDPEGNYDSGGLGSRPQMFIQGIKLVDDDLWIGTGIGSYQKALELKNPKFYNAAPYKDNPHNEFLLITIQLGLVGLFFLIYLFSIQAIYSVKVKEIENIYISQGLFILITIGCMGNSMLLDSGEGHFWSFFTALLFSNLEKN